jgi:hypothetical protein
MSDFTFSLTLYRMIDGVLARATGGGALQRAELPHKLLAARKPFVGAVSSEIDIRKGSEEEPLPSLARCAGNFQASRKSARYCVRIVALRSRDRGMHDDVANSVAGAAVPEKLPLPSRDGESVIVPIQLMDSVQRRFAAFVVVVEIVFSHGHHLLAL